jgi:hypothetical protein
MNCLNSLKNQNKEALKDIKSRLNQAVNNIAQRINSSEGDKKAFYRTLLHVAKPHQENCHEDLKKAEYSCSHSRTVVDFTSTQTYHTAEKLIELLNTSIVPNQYFYEKLASLEAYENAQKHLTRLRRPSPWSRIATFSQKTGLVAGLSVIGAAAGALLGFGIFSVPAAAIGAGLGAAIAGGIAAGSTYLYSNRKTKIEKSFNNMKEAVDKLIISDRSETLSGQLESAPDYVSAAEIDPPPPYEEVAGQTQPPQQFTVSASGSPERESHAVFDAEVSSSHEARRYRHNRAALLARALSEEHDARHGNSSSSTPSSNGNSQASTVFHVQSTGTVLQARNTFPTNSIDNLTTPALIVCAGSVTCNSVDQMGAGFNLFINTFASSDGGWKPTLQQELRMNNCSTVTHPYLHLVNSAPPNGH